nr:hypothetical protein [Tanacetum cinerariifolium]
MFLLLGKLVMDGIGCKVKFDFLLEEFSGELSVRIKKKTRSPRVLISIAKLGVEKLVNQPNLPCLCNDIQYLTLSHIDSIPPGIEEADFDLEKEIRLVENLLYGNSSPRPSEEINAKITDTIVESFTLSHIPVEDNNSQMEEIDLFLNTDDLMPLGIENDDYDSERDIYFLEELLRNDSLPILENESS